MSKIVPSLTEAIRQSGLKSGMTVSFHHHLRNGDYVLNMVMEAISAMGLKDITVAASSILDVHAPLVDHIHSGVVTGLDADFIERGVGRALVQGILPKPVIFRSHGGRPLAIETGELKIDVAFIAAPACDCQGNLNGTDGPSACGSLGYAYPDARHASKVVAVTDYIADYPLTPVSIDETLVDYVVKVDKIGDPKLIVSGTTKITRDPVGLAIAKKASQVIEFSGLLKEGFSIQTGAGGASLAVMDYVKKILEREQIQGSFGLGGITGYFVNLLKEGYLKTLLDVQCFDEAAVQSLKENPAHQEISAARYAGVHTKSCAVDSLDIVVLGATQIDMDFNVNVHTDSNGYIIGGSGGHSDTAAGSKLCIIVAPLSRARTPIVVDRVQNITTPGKTVDVLVTQHGIAVNPLRADLIDQLKSADVPVCEIGELKQLCEKITGIPEPLISGDKTVGKIVYRDGAVIDEIKNILP